MINPDRDQYGRLTGEAYRRRVTAHAEAASLTDSDAIRDDHLAAIRALRKDHYRLTSYEQEQSR